MNKLDTLTKRYIAATSEWYAANRKCTESTDSTPDTTVRHRLRRCLRVFPIPPCLVPVLAAMRAEVTGDGFLFGAHPTGTQLRAALHGAGITRRELHETTDRSRALRMHDCRATGTTRYVRLVKRRLA